MKSDTQLEKEFFYLLEGIVEDTVSEFEEEFSCSVVNVNVELTDDYVKCSGMKVIKLED